MPENRPNVNVKTADNGEDFLELNWKWFRFRKYKIEFLASELSIAFKQCLGGNKILWIQQGAKFTALNELPNNILHLY